MSVCQTEATFRDRFPQATAAIDDSLARGLHQGVQVYVSHAGEPLADAAWGLAETDVPLTAQHAMLWLSSGKPLWAACFARLWERGQVQLDAPVCEYIPQFAAGGKQAITLRHVLTHTGGFRVVDSGWPEATWQAVVSKICEAPLELNWEPGKTAGYHLMTSWVILAEVLSRVTATLPATLLADEVLRPVGMNASTVSLQLGDARPIAPMHWRHKGVITPLDWHLPPRAPALSPGSNTWGPMHDLGRFYETLMAILLANNPASPQTWLSRQTVAAMTARHREGLYDQTLAHVVDFGLGLIVNSAIYGAETVPYGYGTHASPRTFGHGGSQSSQGYCDPDAQLVVAINFGCMAGEGQHNRRLRAFNSGLYADLRLG